MTKISNPLFLLITLFLTTLSIPSLALDEDRKVICFILEFFFSFFCLFGLPGVHSKMSSNK